MILFNLTGTGMAFFQAFCKGIVMQKYKMASNWVIDSLNGVFCRTAPKTVRILVALMTLMLFGDTLLPMFGHVLHVLIEMIELVVEHFLESAFGLSPRQAEIAVGWIGMALISYLSLQLLRKAYDAVWYAYFKVKVRWSIFIVSAKAAWGNVVWIWGAMIIGALGSTFFLMI